MELNCIKLVYDKFVHLKRDHFIALSNESDELLSEAYQLLSRVQGKTRQLRKLYDPLIIMFVLMLMNLILSRCTHIKRAFKSIHGIRHKFQMKRRGKKIRRTKYDVLMCVEEFDVLVAYRKKNALYTHTARLLYLSIVLLLFLNAREWEMVHRHFDISSCMFTDDPIRSVFWVCVCVCVNVLVMDSVWVIKPKECI